jgi:hypothetical protein
MFQMPLGDAPVYEMVICRSAMPFLAAASKSILHTEKKKTSPRHAIFTVIVVITVFAFPESSSSSSSSCDLPVTHQPLHTVTVHHVANRLPEALLASIK